MRSPDSKIDRRSPLDPRRAMALCAAALLFPSVGCLPVIPVCDCKVGGETGGAGQFPDFDFLDRSVECAEAPLPGSPEGEALECGYPEGPYGFEEGDVIENLELFDCAGEAVQLAQYLPQVGLPDVETRGVVFGVGAAWCQPCAEEAAEWAEHFVDEYPRVEFVQVIDEGAVGAATAGTCAGWSAANAQDSFSILWTPDQGSIQLKVGGQPLQPIPFTLLFDANANIIFKQTGGIVDSGVLEIQIDALINDPYGN